MISLSMTYRLNRLPPPQRFAMQFFAMLGLALGVVVFSTKVALPGLGYPLWDAVEARLPDISAFLAQHFAVYCALGGGLWTVHLMQRTVRNPVEVLYPLVDIPGACLALLGGWLYFAKLADVIPPDTPDFVNALTVYVCLCALSFPALVCLARLERVNGLGTYVGFATTVGCIAMALATVFFCYGTHVLAVPHPQDVQCFFMHAIAIGVSVVVARKFEAALHRQQASQG